MPLISAICSFAMSICKPSFTLLQSPVLRHPCKQPVRLTVCPTMAIESVDYDLTLFFEPFCQPRSNEPPFENLVVRIDERIDIFLVDFSCTDKFLDHFVLSAEHMQICNPSCLFCVVFIIDCC